MTWDTAAPPPPREICQRCGEYADDCHCFKQHSGDCTIYRALMNGRPVDGICTCGYGWSLVRQSDWSEMYSAERQQSMACQASHTCHCGTATHTPHVIGESGCVRLMTKPPIMVSNQAGYDQDRGPWWQVDDPDGQPITDFTLRQQRGYHLHECGCWSRWRGSSNSIEA